MGISPKLSALLVAFLAPAVTAAAAVVPTAQTRTIDAEASASVPGDSDSDSDSASAPGFGPFNAEVDPLAIAIANTDVAIAQGVAKQQSSFGPSLITASGESSVSMTLLAFAGGLAAAEGESLFSVDFQVTTPSTYALSGFVDTQAIVTGGASVPILDNEVTFYDLDNAIILFQTLTLDQVIAAAGVLAPGNYRLSAFAEVDASQASSLNDARTIAGISSFDLDLVVSPILIPEPGTVVAAMGLTGLCALAFWRRAVRR